MEYTPKMMKSFINDLLIFDKECSEILEDCSQKVNKVKVNEKNEWTEKVNQVSEYVRSISRRNSELIKKSNEKRNRNLLNDIDQKKGVFVRLYKCNEILALIRKSEDSILDKRGYDENKTKQNFSIDISVDELISEEVDFETLAYNVNMALREGRKKKISEKCSQFYCLCVESEKQLRLECEQLRNYITQNIDILHDKFQEIKNDFCGEIENEWNKEINKLDAFSDEFAAHRDSLRRRSSDMIDETKKSSHETVKKKISNFINKYPPMEFLDEYKRIYNNEPSFVEYECVKELPRNIHISSIEYDMAPFGLKNSTKDILNQYYYFIYNKEKIIIPHCAQFNSEFNYIFKFNGGEERSNVVKNACDLGMRLFMMLPPGKVNFTFIDPITLGESFAIFTRLVDVNDNTSVVINGKIWSSPSDIEEKLRVMTDHIANVTQRCLQGKYDSIFEYNHDAEQNAEAYQVLMLMDFPTGLTDQSLKLLEQIATSGPKCGVFTVLYRNESQVKKISERSLPLVLNIENNFQIFDYNKNANAFSLVGEKIKDKYLLWKDISFPKQDQLDNIIDKLKKGIKNAERIVVSFDKITPPKEDWFKGDCSNELSIPIGVHGANNIQNLTFGIGGSHHALVAGQTGSGKSSLLHTIIMSALIKYPANQLQIFLVDFKRGVEFKIYANYALENFKVIAIESEREFGCSVLEYLDKEQSKRADKFKRLNVDNVEDYRKRSGDVLPRILLIIDEFHVLFSKDTSDMNSRNSAIYLEQIIRQGRAFGIHIILASQTMSNIGGINYGVWGQVGVRIALKCPKSDAKFVLGSDNDGVDLLSGDNPGQAVYNSDCGNVVANTVFRVAYIDQDEQDTYLRFISENEPRFDYPATRVMLSNVEDNIYNPLQRFAQGENCKFVENAIYVGEPLKIINNMKMVFKQKQSSNMLVIGNDEQKARTLFTFAVLSITLHALTKNMYHSPQMPTIYLFDYAPLEVFDDRDDSLLHISKMLSNYVKYIPFDEADDSIRELYQIFKHREKNDEQNEETYMLVYGLQRARNWRSNDVYKKNVKFDEFDEFDEFSENSYRNDDNMFQKHLSVKPYDMLLNLLQRGAAFNINSIIWEDNFKLFMNSYADMLPNFDMRIAFSIPDDDSINFIEEVNGSKIGENGAIYNYNGNQRFRPYKKPDTEWLEKICDRINQF